MREVGDGMAARIWPGSTLRGRASGIEMDVPFAWLIRFREERALDLQIFSEPLKSAEAAAKDLESSLCRA